MKKSKITFVDGDDWEGLYINNKLVLENHSLRISDVLKALGIKYESIIADDEWLASCGNLPENLADVKEG